MYRPQSCVLSTLTEDFTSKETAATQVTYYDRDTGTVVLLSYCYRIVVLLAYYTKVAYYNRDTGTHTYIHIHIHVRIYILTYIHIHTYTHSHTPIHTHTYTHTHLHIFTY
jgi:hypothetical protein